MFEYKLQESWQNYKNDFGLGRNCLFVSFFNLFIFLYSFIFLGTFRLMLLLPLVISMTIALFSKKFKGLTAGKTLAINILFLAFIIPFNYTLTGIVDIDGNILDRYDETFARFDQLLLGASSSANYVQGLIGNYWWSKYFYNWLQFSYMFFYIFPFYVTLVYYQGLRDEEKYLVGRLMTSICIFFSMNYFLYVVIPVTGPQYFIPSEFTLDLPFTAFGRFLNNIVRNGQPTFIDCFPSGHMGISLLCTIWFARMKSKHFYVSAFFAIGIGIATIALRYHYLLDLIAAVPLVIFCYKISERVIPVPVIRRKEN